MTDEHIMEDLSRHYIEAIANNAGYFNQAGRDYGTDLTIRRAFYDATRKRYFAVGKAIDIQVKAVSEKYVFGYSDTKRLDFSYFLESKNYNDLIDRRDETGNIIPIYLAIFVMPKDKTDWLSHSVDNLQLRRCAYWYEIDAKAVKDTSKKRIKIVVQKANTISQAFFIDQFAKLD